MYNESVCCYTAANVYEPHLSIKLRSFFVVPTKLSCVIACYLVTTDPRELEQFTRHLLGLGLGEQLVPLLSALEEEHRRRLHPAEEELEGGGGGGGGGGQIIDAMVFLVLL